jgi:hypothetical protein
VAPTPHVTPLHLECLDARVAVLDRPVKTGKTLQSDSETEPRFIARRKVKISPLLTNAPVRRLFPSVEQGLGHTLGPPGIFYLLIDACVIDIIPWGIVVAGQLKA